MAVSLEQLSRTLILSRAKQLKSWRAIVMSQLYPSLPTLDGDRQQSGDPVVREAVVQLSNTFTRYTQTQATYVDESGGSGSIRTNTTGSTNILERQVNRAIAQVLGRAPGNSPDSFVRAINDVFPTTNEGRISFTSSRSAVSLYGQNNSVSGQEGYTTQSNGAMSAGLVGQLSANQATLYRQATVISADALKVLHGLQSFVPESDQDKLDALRSLIADEIKSLVEEFGRVDEPRFQRVESYFNQLSGPNGHLSQFGDRAFLNNRCVVPTTLDDEAQVAGYKLLVN